MSNLIKITAVGSVVLGSVNFTMIGSAEGLVYLAQRQELAKREFDKVIGLTESNATIITQHHDKLFFPERKVIVGLFDDKNMTGEYANLVRLLPVYYYNFTFPDKDFNYLNERRLREYNLKIEKIETITSDFTLYKISEI